MTTLLTLAALLTAPPPESKTPVRLVGVVTEHGVGTCVDGRTTEWTQKHYRVGNVEVAPGSVDLSERLGESVLVTGVVTGEGGPQPSSPLGTTPCGMEQMRNDWYATPSGTRRWDGGSTPFGKLVVTAVEPFSGAALSRKAQDLVLELTPPKDAGKVSVEVSVEYLGNAGKPNSSFDERKTSIKAGGSAKLTFAVSRGTTKSDHRSGESANTLVISGGASTLFFDLRLRPPGPRK